ncbi:MAG TPA: phosphonate C-P lyase system protein PhnL [Rhodospirillaceae bacterium]|nr:phosphonate C-P lyase system protein PhnL [Rhodospirillaceae bacterium]HAT34820.1 phosphonate C-P lyase system protein PhnL [Rhodospirillaceae bacterium]
MASRKKTMITVKDLTKTFTLHLREGIKLPVLESLSLTVRQGECVVLAGPSGIGKSSLLRCIYANYLPQTGSVKIRHDDKLVDLTNAAPATVLAIRRTTMGYVSQFLRVVPRVATIDLVMEPLLALGGEPDAARERAADLLSRLRIPERLWTVPPATFSGGEQQRVNIARSFAVDYPILLLDEPTAALDAENRQTVVSLINETRDAGAAIVGIFHDEEVREAVGTSEFDLTNHLSNAA